MHFVPVRAFMQLGRIGRGVRSGPERTASEWNEAAFISKMAGGDGDFGGAPWRSDPGRNTEATG